MIVISHRGYWVENYEKNTKTAFERSFSLGFGTETDIRDFNGELVISHDIASAESMSFSEFINIYKSHKVNGPLALNVKADGLQTKIKSTLEQYGVDNYFLFDMSVPDSLGYFAHNLNTFVRLSEYETLNSLYEKASGVWVDGFHETQVTEALLQKIVDDGKQACIVSSELHRRDHSAQWQLIKSFGSDLTDSDNIILCTDLPEHASEYFYG